MLKKAGIITVGVGAALLAAAPLASAGEYQGDDNGGNNDHGHHSNDHGNHHGHHNNGHGKQHGVGNVQCSAESGAVKGNRTEGILALGPILDGNAGQLLSCNSFLNDVASHNKTRIASPLL